MNTPNDIERSSAGRKRSTLERVSAFYTFLELNGSCYISDFKQDGFDNRSVRNLIKIIRLIQSKPSFIVNQAGRFTTIRLESDHHD